MAVNWTMAAALNAVKENKKEAIIDLGKRFPLTLKALIECGDNSGAATIIGALPDHITVRKIESVLKDGVQEVTDEDDVEDTEQEDDSAKKSAAARKAKRAAKKAKESKENDEQQQDYSEMSARELFDLCKKRGIAVKPKQSEEAYIKLLKKADAAEEESEEDDWDDEEEKPVKKPAKKDDDEDDEDDDEDWDI